MGSFQVQGSGNVVNGPLNWEDVLRVCSIPAPRVHLSVGERREGKTAAAHPQLYLQVNTPELDVMDKTVNIVHVV